MNQIVHTDFPTRHDGVKPVQNARAAIGQLSEHVRGAKGLAGVLVAGGVSAAIVVADQIISAWADGHLLMAWIAMWVVVFTLLAVFSDAIRGWPEALHQRIATWKATKQQRDADERTWSAALGDPRLMAELQFALIHAEQEAAKNGEPPPYWPFANMPAQRANPHKWA